MRRKASRRPPRTSPRPSRSSLSESQHLDQPAVPDGDGGLVRLRLDIAYDGSQFSGWAIQPTRRTVQGVLQDRLAQVLRGPVALTVAGRTDTGVHATGQVAHLDVPGPTWADLSGSLLRRLSGLLPEDVRVTAVTAVPADFDARFAALWRRYEYRINDAETGAPPLNRVAVLPWRRRLDASAMADAATLLCGERDFAAFCRRREGATTIRRIEQFDVSRDGDLILATIRADAFCHSMVRSLIGALIAVGEGRRSVDWPASLLARTVRADEVSVAAARGLTLVEVGYPPEDQLAARTQATRRVRVALTTTE